MAGFKAEFEFHGLDDAKRIFQRVGNLGEDTRPLLSIWAAILEASTLRRFETGRGPGGIPWPATKRQTRQAVGRTGPNKAQILVDTGDLRDSIRTEVRANELEIGSDGLKNPVKALANQYGSHRQTVVVRHQRVINSAFGIPLPQPKVVDVRPHGMVTNLPARPFIGIDAEDRADMIEEGTIYLRSLFNA